MQVSDGFVILLKVMHLKVMHAALKVNALELSLVILRCTERPRIDLCRTVTAKLSSWGQARKGQPAHSACHSCHLQEGTINCTKVRLREPKARPPVATATLHLRAAFVQHCQAALLGQSQPQKLGHSRMFTSMKMACRAA